MSLHAVPTAVRLPPWLKDARLRGMLSRLPDHLVAAVIQGGQRVGYPAAAVVPGWEDRPWGALVLSGCVRVYLTSGDGSQLTLRYMRPGDMVGAFDSTRSSLSRSLQVLQAAELLHIDVAHLQSLARSEAAVAYEMLLEMTRTLRIAHRAYSIRAFGSVKVRVANAILERAGACGDVATGTVVPGTQHDLAIAAGTVREVVASALHTLKAEGIVEVRRGRLVILDIDRLNRAADGGLGLGLGVD